MSTSMLQRDRYVIITILTPTADRQDQFYYFILRRDARQKYVNSIIVTTESNKKQRTSVADASVNDIWSCCHETISISYALDNGKFL